MGPPERIIAGVVLCERLAVGMYGAVHRAQREGQRHLRALVVEPRLLAEPGFHRELLESSQADKVIALTSDQIVPMLAIESEGPEVVVLTRGVGRYVTVQDMLASARARGFKIERSVVAAVAIATGEALAAAHRAQVVHGAVHPRSVLVDEGGVIRLTDFGVGRALTSAVAQGGDSALWRGLAGFLAPELAIGVAPGPESDVFALGALVFVMLTGDAPPGALATTPAVERVVSKALDTEAVHRYRHPEELAAALRVAFSTDGWAIASPADIIAAAGLESMGGGLDSDTEDLLAALGSASPAPVRPNMDLRAEAVAARVSGNESGTRLDALLADLGEEKDHPGPGHGSGPAPTPVASERERGRSPRRAVEPAPVATGRGAGSRARGAAASPDLSQDRSSDPPSTMASSYDVTPLPPPQPQSELLAPLPAQHLESTASAALGALADLRDPTEITRPPPMTLEDPPASVIGDDSVTQIQVLPPRPKPRPAPPMVELPPDAPVPSLRRSPAWSALWVALLIGAVIATVMVVRSQREQTEEDRKRHEQDVKTAQELTAKLSDDLPDPGAIRLGSSPSEATGWLLLGRTPLDSIPLPSSMVHQLRVELERHRPQELIVDGAQWQGVGESKVAKLSVKLERLGKGPATLPASPPEPAPGKSLSPGAGKIHFESEPAGAAVWLYIGVTGSIEFRGVAGREYELRALKEGYLPGYARISVDDWRETRNGAPVTGPIDSVAKKSAIDVQITLTPDPEAPEPGGAVRRRGG